MRKGIILPDTLGSKYRAIATFGPDCCHNLPLRHRKVNKSECAMLPYQTQTYAKPATGSGFTAGTLILTPQGPAFVESLQPGDLVMTRDHGPRPLRALHRNLSGPRAVTVAPEAIGPGLPWRHLRLAPTQRVAMSGWKADLLFGVAETLVAVGELVSDGTILARTAIGATVTWQPVFDTTEIIYAEGIEVEVSGRLHAALHIVDTAKDWDPAAASL